jgi:hypothetical protein
MTNSQSSSSTVLQLFKKVYGQITDIVPQGFKGLEMTPFSERAKVGNSYIEAVILQNETGITVGGTGGDLFDINPARAGAVRQAEVTPSVTVLSSVIPWSVMSRSAGGGEKSFADGTKHLIKNNLKSHMHFMEVWYWYGQAAALLGYVSYATATYRGISFTNGGGALGGVTFTAGVNTTSKAILLAPGSFAAGHWVGQEGCTVNQVDSTGAIVASGSLLSVDSENGILYVDFTPVAATSTTSHRLCYDGMQAAREMVGVNKILKNTGSLFGISASTSSGFSLWRGTQQTLSATLLSFDRMQTISANAVNRGGLDQDLEVHVNPRSFAKLLSAEAARRMYDSSYKGSEIDNGAEKITFYYSGGKMEVVPNRFIKEGEAYGLVKDSWVRGGSAEISLRVPGMQQDIVFALENSSGYAFRSFSDQYILCRAPARNWVMDGINDESAT